MRHAPGRDELVADDALRVDRVVGGEFEEHLERDPRLEPRDGVAETEMDPVTEGPVILDRALEVEDVGAGEDRLVVARRSVE